jgi:hypothetical protein
MKEVRTEININAPAEKVWKILTNFKDYHNWNPFLRWLTGKVAVNNKIAVRIAPPGANAMTFNPTVLKFDRNKEFRWLGHLLFPGLFDGEHIFELTDNGNGTTSFVHREQFRGILIPLFSKKLDVNTRQGFELMNEKLKEQAERQ